MTQFLQQTRDHFWRTLSAAQRVLLIVPKNPDGDSIGSITALIGVLRALHISYTAVTMQDIPSYWSSIAFVEEICRDLSCVRGQSYDCAIIPDAGDLRYTGAESLLQSLSRRPLLINIDHHITNEEYGDVNLVDPSAASTTEMLAIILQEQKFSFSSGIATSLLTGILTDTGHFSNPATTEHAVATAAFLLEQGARFPVILHSTRKNKKIPDLRSWGKAFMRLEKRNPWGIAVTVLLERDIGSSGEKSVEGISNFLNTLDGVRAVLVLRERAHEKIQGSFRTTRNDVDVSRLALLFGGGGHKKAAGFTIDGRLVETAAGWKVE